jgi:NTP pyrophosphatase (non-canonical NTP hydrolase)
VVPEPEPTRSDRIDDLTAALRQFADERDWAQFHTPKNLVMALVGEVGELVEHFQWLTPEESVEVIKDETSAPRIADELADVLIYLVRLADVLGVDLLEAARTKREANARRYPADRVRGSAGKAPPLD